MIVTVSHITVTDGTVNPKGDSNDGNFHYFFSSAVPVSTVATAGQRQMIDTPSFGNPLSGFIYSPYISSTATDTTYWKWHYYDTTSYLGYNINTLTVGGGSASGNGMWLPPGGSSAFQGNLPISGKLGAVLKLENTTSGATSVSCTITGIYLNILTVLT